MEHFIKFLADAAVFLGSRAGTVILVTATLSALMGYVILRLHKRVLPKESWALYFSAAFFVLAVQYLCLSWGIRPQWFNTWPDLIWSLSAILCGIVNSTASPVNNYLFLVTGLYLMAFPDEGARLPKWPIVPLILSAISLWLFRDWPYHRLPDAICSFATLGFLGYALYVNFKPTRPLLGWLNLTGALFYGACNLLYGLLPLLPLDNTPWSTYFDEELRNLDITIPMSAVTGYESLLMAAMFVLKLGLFLGAFLLIQQCLLNLVPKKTGSSKSNNPEEEMLSVGGFPRYLTQKMGADHAALHLLHAGQDARVESYSSSEGDAAHQTEQEGPKPGSYLAHVVNTRKPLSSVKWTDSPLSEQFELDPPSESVIIQPVLYHGEPVAVFVCAWKARRAFTATTLVQTDQLASALAPIAQSHRQQMALEALNRALEGSYNKDLEQVVVELLEKILKILNPKGAGLFVKYHHMTLAVYCERNKPPKITWEQDYIKLQADVFNSDHDALYEENLLSEDADKGVIFFAVAEEKPYTNGLPILLKTKTFRSVVAQTLQRITLDRLDSARAREMELALVRSDAPALLMHEFKNQVATLKMGLNNLEDDIVEIVEKDHEAALARVTRLKQTVERADRIVASNNRRPNFEDKESFQLNEVFTLIKERYEPLLTDCKIQLDIHSDADLPINQSLNTTYQALSNLISNAIDAIHKDGKIRIETQQRERYCDMIVKSTSEIPEDIQARLFERGFTTKERGTGLGLTLCRDSLRREGGDLKFAGSRDEWTSFVITLRVKESGGEVK